MRTNIQLARLMLIAAMANAAQSAFGQSFNIDMDGLFGPPSLGIGAPSSSFGGAAGTPGHWNLLGGLNNIPLNGLNGQTTSARIVGPVGGSGGGNNIPINTGDYALLLNDARSVGWITVLHFNIEGLQNGAYDVYTYAVSISSPNSVQRTGITISEAIGPQTRISTGPMPGNQLIEGVTHTRHTVNVTNGRISFALLSMDFGETSYLNGIQIVQVPEPTSVLGLTSGFLFLIRRCGRQRRERA